MALAESAERYQSFRSRDRRPTRRRFRRAILALLLLFLIYSFVSTFFLTSIQVDSISMVPTVEAGQRLFATPLVLGPRVSAFSLELPAIRSPDRGDLVAIHPPHQDGAGAIVRLVDPILRFVSVQRYRIGDGDGWRSSLQVKRIIGLPGDTVRMERFVGYVKPANENAYQHEFALSPVPYELITDDRPDGWLGDDPFGGAMPELQLGENEYFVLGDNRNAAIDSRHWGAISFSDIHSLVIFRYWPLRKVGPIH